MISIRPEKYSLVYVFVFPIHRLTVLPLVCNEAIAILFMFDLSRKSTLASVKDWYRQARLLNKSTQDRTERGGSGGLQLRKLCFVSMNQAANGLRPTIRLLQVPSHS